MEQGIVVMQKRTKATRSAILDAAKMAFSTRGFDKITLRELADAAEVHHTNLRYHFGSKEDLWLELMKMLFEDAKNYALKNPVRPDCENSIAHFKEITHKRISYIANKPELFRILNLETLTNSPRLELIAPYIRSFDMRSYRMMCQFQSMGIGVHLSMKDLIVISNSLLGAPFINPRYNLVNAEEYFDLEQLIDKHTNLITQLIIGN